MTMRMVWGLLALLYCLDSLGALPTAAADTTGYTMLGTRCSTPSGTPQIPATYDDAGVSAALTAASGAADKIVRFDSNFTPTSRIDIPDNVTIFSTSGAVITSTTTARGFRLNNASGVYGLRFTGARPLELKSSAALTTAPVVSCNDFYDITSQAIYDASTSDNALHAGLTVQWNKFERHSYSVWLTRMRNCVITDNYMSASTNRNIENHGSRGCQFSRNRISGGITGILALADSQYLRHSATYIANSITDNWLSDITEEGISFDQNADSAANTSLIDQFTVCTAGTCGGTGPTSGSWNSSPRVLVLCASCSGILSGGTGGYSLTFVTGANAGKSFLVATAANSAPASAGTTIYIQLQTTSQAGEDNITSAEFSAIAGGEIVSLNHQAMKNTIARNWCDNVRTCIVHWGMGYNNTITGNIITRVPGTGDIFANRAISSVSLCGLASSTRFANNNNTTSTACGIADYNLIANNSTNDNITVGGKSYASLGNTLGASVTHSNTIANNYGTVVRDPYYATDNVTQYGTALNNAALSLTNSAYSASAFVGTGTPDSPDDFRLGGSSAGRRSGTELNLGNIQDYSNRAFSHPPSIGAWEAASGDIATARTAASTRSARQ